MVSPVVIGLDGAVYGWTTHGLTALTATGKQRWTVAGQEFFGGPPALGSDGLVRASGQLDVTSGTKWEAQPAIALFAVSPRGKRLWTIRSLPWATVPNSVPFSKLASPIVTEANQFYVPFVGPSYSSAQNNGVEIVGAGGVPIRRLLAGFGGPIAVAPNGTVYQLGYNYAGQSALLAGRPGGNVLWRRPVMYEQTESVMVGRHGTVYVSDGAGWGPHDAAEVSAYTPDGHRLWRRETNAGVATLAERQDGTILVADAHGLAAISASGAPLWRTPLGRSSSNAGAPSLAVDSAGTAYVGSADGEVRAVSPSGAVLWTVRAGGPSRPWEVSSVTLGPNGILTVVGTDGVLRVFR
jgi:outer membrane protein assembly factor BamB